MALFHDGQLCPLCELPMQDNDRLFATSHFLGPDSDLWKYSDAVMHWNCYAKWEHRARFARMYFETNRRMSEHNPYWGIAHVDEQVFVTVNPNKLVGEVRVMLAETGNEFRIALTEWTDWLSNEWVEKLPHMIVYDALSAVIPLLQTKLPSAESVIVSAGMQKSIEERRTESGLVGRISYEFACEKLAVRAADKGITCPSCGTFSTNYEYMRIAQISESGPQSHLVCRHCNKEFGPLDL